MSLEEIRNIRNLDRCLGWSFLEQVGIGCMNPFGAVKIVMGR